MTKPNSYVSANYALGKIDPAGLYGPGVEVQTALAWFVPATTDIVGSVYRLFKGIPGDAIVTSLEILCEQWASSCTGSIGLYQVLSQDNVGAVINAGAELTSAYNLNTGAPASAGWVNILLAAVSIPNRIASLWTLAGQVEYPPKFAAYDICLTLAGATAGNAANTAVKLGYIRNV